MIYFFFMAIHYAMYPDYYIQMYIFAYALKKIIPVYTDVYLSIMHIRTNDNILRTFP